MVNFERHIINHWLVRDSQYWLLLRHCWLCWYCMSRPLLDLDSTLAGSGVTKMLNTQGVFVPRALSAVSAELHRVCIENRCCQPKERILWTQALRKSSYRKKQPTISKNRRSSQRNVGTGYFKMASTLEWKGQTSPQPTTLPSLRSEWQQTTKTTCYKNSCNLTNVFRPGGTIDDQVVQIRLAVRHSYQDVIYHPLKSCRCVSKDE